MRTKIYSFICVIGILLGLVLLFPSCESDEGSGVVDARINDGGELILIYQDGTEQNLGPVVGSDGEKGENGSDGADGKDGKDGDTGADGADGKNGADGTDGVDGADGSLVISSDGSSIPAASAKGLRSAVSIVCNFQTTVQQGGWYPGYGSTTTKEYSSAGSGVIYQMDRAQGDAFIITNYHVVYDASSLTENGISDDISVYLYGAEIQEKAIEASYVGGSLYYDIAVLHVDNSDEIRNSEACQIDVADSDTVVVGDTAIAIGNAKGYGVSASFGVVSVDSEYIKMTAADGVTSVSFRVMRIDTAVNSGNSGGGLYDDEGNLIGIVNAKIVDDGVENIGYAIPSNIAVSIADNIIDYCYGTEEERVQRAILGITVITSDSKAVYNGQTGFVHIEETVKVYEIVEDSLAEGVLKEGDVLVSASVNGESFEITRKHHVIDMMLDVRVGDTVSFCILRDGSEKEVSITITEDCLTSY